MNEKWTKRYLALVVLFASIVAMSVTFSAMRTPMVAFFDENFHVEFTEDSNLGLQMRSDYIVVTTSSLRIIWTSYVVEAVFGGEFVLVVTSFADAMENLPKEAIEIHITCWNYGEKAASFKISNNRLIKLVTDFCTGKDLFSMIYGYPPAISSEDPLS